MAIKALLVARHGYLQLHTGQLSCNFFLTSDQPEIENLDPNYVHSGGGFFNMILYTYISTNSHQGLSNEGSNFILSSLEVGH